MCIVAAIGGTIASAAIGASSASDAANAQTQAANTAAQTQLQMYNQTRSDLLPYSQAGSNAFSQLANLFGFGSGSGTGTTSTVGAAGSTPQYQTINIPGYGPIQIPNAAATANNITTGSTGTGIPNTAAMTTALENTPGYQFTLGQGTQALDRSAASKGLVLSGAQLKDAQAYGQGLAMSNAWTPYVQQLDTAASLGENAAAQTGNAGASAAAGAAQSQLAAGQSTAAGITGVSNQLTSGISGLSSQLLSSYGGIGGIPSSFSPSSQLTADAGSNIASNASIF
jgi:hypothetical protein